MGGCIKLCQHSQCKNTPKIVLSVHRKPVQMSFPAFSANLEISMSKMGASPHAHTHEQGSYFYIRRHSSVSRNWCRCCFSLVPVSLPAPKKQSGELPTNQREGQAGQATFVQCSCRGSDCSGFCSQCLYPLN